MRELSKSQIENNKINARKNIKMWTCRKKIKLQQEFALNKYPLADLYDDTSQAY